MSNMIKTNFAFPDANNLDTQGKRLAQDLSLNFKSLQSSTSTINKAITSINNAIAALPIPTAYVDVTFDFATYGGSIVGTHNLGATPTGWYVIDAVYVSGSPVIYSLIRSAWDATTITIQSLGGTQYKMIIRVFI
jgi:uncharacterized ubiquitin-like protein YukD